MNESIRGLEGLSEIADKVAIASTMHEPNQSLLEAIERITPSFINLGLKWNIAITGMTRDKGDRRREFYDLLTGNFNVKVDSDVFPTAPKGGMIEANHILAYRMGVESGLPFVLYTDSDRVSLANYYPEEFARVVNTAVRLAEEGNRVVAIGRSPQSINTHIASLVLTEGIIHHFYKKHVPTDGFLDSTSASYLVPTGIFEQILTKYNPEETFLSVQANYPQPKVLLYGATLGGGLALLVTQDVLRYEAPEQFRGAGDITVPNHEWNPEGYDRVTLASRGRQEEIMSNTREWEGRFKTVHEFLEVLRTLKDVKDSELDSVVDEVKDFTGKMNADQYRKKAVELSNKYSYV